MEYAKYSCNIQEVLEKMNDEGLEKLVRNVVKYITEENKNKTNWLAYELLTDVISEEDISEIFDEE